jgi:hypothetical protein
LKVIFKKIKNMDWELCTLKIVTNFQEISKKIKLTGKEFTTLVKLKEIQYMDCGFKTNLFHE